MTEEKVHSKLGASSAYRWINCAGSVRLCSEMPEKESSPWAIEGTNAHTLSEKVFNFAPNAFFYTRNKIDPKTKKPYFDFEVTEEMAEHVQEYVDEVRALRNEIQGELLVERGFHLKSLHPDFFGTCDAIVYDDLSGVLHVFDFKYGAGIFVSVTDNPQLMYYALGALMELGIKNFRKIVMHICQPRIEFDVDEPRVQTLKPQDLVQFGKFLKQRALETEKPNAPLTPGEHCRFCKAAPRCPALHTRAVEVARTDFDDDFNLPSIELLSDEQIEKVVQYGKQIENWIKAVKAHALEETKSGRRIKGLKLVNGKGSRNWTNEIEAEKTLGSRFGSRIYSKKLLSVAQAEKVLGKDSIKGLFQKFSGNPTIAHETDRRKALPSAQDDFGLIEGISKDDF